MKALTAITAIFIGATVAGTCSAPQPQRPLAPDFSLVDLQGRRVSLADYKGKVVLLDFWATWCVPCETEIPRLVEWQEKYRAQGLQVIGISMDDSPEPVSKFYRQFRINYPVALGTEKVARAYGGILGLPVNLLIDRDGRIQAKYTGETDLHNLQQEIERLLTLGRQSKSN